MLWVGGGGIYVIARAWDVRMSSSSPLHTVQCLSPPSTDLARAIRGGTNWLLSTSTEVQNASNCPKLPPRPRGEAFSPARLLVLGCTSISENGHLAIYDFNEIEVPTNVE